jgi:hypothetical protein
MSDSAPTNRIDSSPCPMASQARHKLDAPMNRSLRDPWSSLEEERDSLCHGLNEERNAQRAVAH